MNLTPRHILFAMATLSLSACVSSGRVATPQAYTNPNMDFALIDKLAILPMFPESIEDQELSGAFGRYLEAELATRQAQWKILGSREMLQIINSGLGTGYKNLQADFNTPASGMSQVVFSPSTLAFLRQLQVKTKANGFIVGKYALDSPMLPGILGSLLAKKLPPNTRIRVSLLYAKGASIQSWWAGTVVSRHVSETELQKMAASIAANLGKGTLIQL